MQSAMAATYLDVERLLWKIAHDFAQKYGGDVEEYFSDSLLAFMRAYRTYHTAHVSFTTWLRTAAWRAMLDSYRTRLGKIARRKLNGGLETAADLSVLADTTPAPFDIEVFSPDVQTVIRLVFDLPPDIQTSQTKAKNTLRKTLRALGWSAARIAETFTEIRRVI